MAEFVACTACQRPFKAGEATCPFCRTAAPCAKRQGSRVWQGVKVGGLMAFTAATTAACYGAPPPPGSFSGPRAVPTIEAPRKQVPQALNHSFVFVTPTGGKEAAATVLVGARSVADTQLALSGPTKDEFDFAITVAQASDLKEQADKTFKPIDLATAKSVSLTVKGADGKPLVLATPGKAFKGTLQLSRNDAEGVAGTLLAEVDGTAIAVYFSFVP